MTPGDPNANPAPLSSWSATFFTRLYRYQALLRRRWWILVLTVSGFVCYQAYQAHQATPLYQSTARMMVSGRFNIPEGSTYNEETSNFFGTQIELMTSREVQQRAEKRLQKTRPELTPIHVDIRAYQAPRTSIFILQATGTEPEYTRAYLDACMNEYVNYKREMRAQTSQSTSAAITDELLRLETEIRSSEEELLSFQKENNVVLLQEQGNSSASYLGSLNSQLSNLQAEAQLLDLLTLDQNMDRQQKANVASQEEKTDKPGAITPENDYLKARQQITLLEAQRAELGRDLKPKHPKIVRLNDEIEHQKNLIGVFKQQSMDQLKTHQQSLRLQIQNLTQLIKTEEVKALDSSRRMADYQRIKGKLTRLQSLYDRLLNGVKSVDVNTNIDQELLTIMENASVAASIQPGVGKGIATGVLTGLIVGIGILFLLDRIDDRINSLTELRDHFEEPVFGQIPLDALCASTGKSLLQIDDPRHIYAESYRNIRSSLLFMASNANRPRTLLITSAVPNEGKSTVASNFAVTMAFSGSKVLLVDADLRRGVVHEAFELPASPGLADVLHHDLPWKQAVRPTLYENLTILPRGNMPSQPGELFLQQSTADLWKEMAEFYDYVIIDSAPILATDDTQSLAPQIEATLFVVRASFTSARLTKNALESLYQRQVNILGLIFNCVNTNLPEYSYYKYKQYYTASKIPSSESTKLSE